MTQDDRANPGGPASDKRALRERGATIGGYVGFVFGFLGQLSVASESPDQFHMGQAAFFVLALMIAGFAVGWLLAPLFRDLFGQP